MYPVASARGARGLVLGVPNTVGVDGEDRLALGQAGAIVDLADPLFTPPLPADTDTQQLESILVRNRGGATRGRAQPPPLIIVGPFLKKNAEFPHHFWVRCHEL